MKRLLVFGLSLGLVAALAVPAAANGGKEYILYADKDVEVGKVTVSGGPKADLLIELTGDWCMTQLHAHAATLLADIPQNSKGNPAIGQFEVNEPFDSCKKSYSFSIPDTAEDGHGPFFAVHLDVQREGTKTIFSDEATKVVAFMGEPLITPQAAVAAFEPVGYDACGGYKISPAAGSAWDTGNGGTASNDAGKVFDGAKWIWRTAAPEFQEAGEYVTFKRELSNPGVRTGGKILITADNGYRLFLNDDVVGSGQVGDGFPPSLSENNVKTNGWQTPETFDVPPGTADVTMKVIAANEWMKGDPDGGPQNPTTGIMGEAGGKCPNPGGLIFKVKLDYIVSETAWADGDRFSSGSWATYFKYYAPEPI